GHFRGVQVRGVGVEPTQAASKTAGLPLADPRQRPAGVEPAFRALATRCSQSQDVQPTLRPASSGRRTRTSTATFRAWWPTVSRSPSAAEGEGLEPSCPCGPLFSRQASYQLLIPSLKLWGWESNPRLPV